MLVFNNYIYKNKKSKLYFGDHVVVLKDFCYQTGGSITYFHGSLSLMNSLFCDGGCLVYPEGDAPVCGSLH
jgi:hypothetical protein